MLFFTRSQVVSLKEIGADAYLPSLKVFPDATGLMHLSPECTDVAAKTCNFLDAKVGVDCETCCYSPGWSSFTELGGFLATLEMYLERLYETENMLVHPQNNFFHGLGGYGEALAFLRRQLAPYTEVLAGKDILFPLAEVVAKRSADAETAIVAKLRSSEMRELILRTAKGPNLLAAEANSVLIQVDKLADIYLAAAESYGRQIVPGKYLISGPETLLSFLTFPWSSQVQINEDVPVEVQETMASLWDPDSDGVLKNAENALVAAWELTPGIT